MSNLSSQISPYPYLECIIFVMLDLNTYTKTGKVIKPHYIYYLSPYIAHHNPRRDRMVLVFFSFTPLYIHICTFLSTHAHKYESSVSHKVKKAWDKQGPQPHKYLQCLAISCTNSSIFTQTFLGNFIQGYLVISAEH